MDRSELLLSCRPFRIAEAVDSAARVSELLIVPLYNPERYVQQSRSMTEGCVKHDPNVEQQITRCTDWQQFRPDADCIPLTISISGILDVCYLCRKQ